MDQLRKRLRSEAQPSDATAAFPISPSNADAVSGSSPISAQAMEMSLASWFRQRLLNITKSPGASNSAASSGGATSPRIASASGGGSFALQPEEPAKDLKREVEEKAPNTPCNAENVECMVNEQMRTARVWIGVVGVQASGKSLLINTLLEATSQFPSSIVGRAPISDKERNYDEAAKNNRVNVTIKPEEWMTWNLDERFEKSIDWTIETQRTTLFTESIYNNKASEKDLDLGIQGDNLSFFLPQKGGTISSSSKTLPEISVRYGVVPELFAIFKNSQQVSGDQSPPAHARALFGKKIRFRGSGKNIDIDRIFIRTKLRELTSSYWQYLQSVEVLFPSDLLQGNRKFVEITVPQIQDQLDSSENTKSNFVILLVDEGGLVPALSNWLIKSAYISKLVRSPQQYQLVIVKSQTIAASNQQWMGQVRGQLLQLIQSHAPQPYASIASKIVQVIPILNIYPNRYTALRFANGLANLRNMTNIPLLSATIDNARILRCAVSLKHLISVWSKHGGGNRKSQEVEDAASGTHKRQRSQSLDDVNIEEKLTEESLSDKIQNMFGELKKDLIDASEYTSGHLSKKAQESYESAAEQWNSFKQRYMNSYDLSKMICDPRYGGKRLGADLSAFLCLPLMKGSAECWKQSILYSLPPKLDSISKSINSLFVQSITSNFKEAAATSITMVDKIRLKRLMEYCERVTKNMNLRFSEMKKEVHKCDPQSLAQEVCDQIVKERILMQSDGCNSLAKLHQLVQDSMPDVSKSAAKRIQAFLNQIVAHCLEQIRIIESEIISSSSIIFVAVKSRPGDVTTNKETQLILDSSTDTSFQQNEESVQAFKPMSTESSSSSSSNTGVNFPSFTATVSSATSASFSAAFLNSKERTSNQTTNFVKSSDSKQATVSSTWPHEQSENEKVPSLEPWALVTGSFINFEDIENIQQYFSNGAATLFSSLSRDDIQHYEEGLERANLLKVVVGEECSQYRVESLHLFGSEHGFLVLRMQLMAEILTNESLYAKMIHDTFTTGPQQFAALFSRSSVDAGHITLMAFANCFQVDVLLYSPLFKLPILIRSTSGSTNKIFCFSYEGPNSYKALVSRSRTVIRKATLPITVQNLKGGDKAEKQLDREPSHSAEPNNFANQLQKSKESAQLASDNQHTNTTAPLHGEPSEIDMHWEKFPRYGSHSFLQYNKQHPPCDMMEIAESDEASNDEDWEMAEVASSVSNMSVTEGRKQEPPKIPIIRRFPVVHADGTRSPPSLLQLCVLAIAKDIDLLPPLNGSIPGELIQELLTCLIKHRLIDDSVLSRIIAESDMHRLILANCRQLSTISCAIIAKSCSRLRILDVSNTNINEVGVSKIITDAGHCLRHINMACSKASDACLHAIAQRCRDLEFIDCSNCPNISNVGVANILSRCFSLKTIKFSGCLQLSDAALQTFPRFLQELDLADCENVTDAALQALAESTNQLVIFKAGGPLVTDCGVDLLCQAMSSLEELHLRRSGVTDKIGAIVSRSCPKLRVLKLPMCEQISSNLFIPEMASLRLEEICVARCLNINNAAIERACHIFPYLKVLDVSGCEEITDLVFTPKILGQLSGLEKFNISKCMHLRDRSIVSVGEFFKNLKELRLYGLADGVTDKSIAQVALSCRNLRLLDLSLCESIGNEGLIGLADCKALEDISLNDTSITDTGLEYFVESCKALRSLRLSHCPGITDQSITALKVHCPLLESLDLSFSTTITVSMLAADMSQFWPYLKELRLRGFHEISGRGFAHHNIEILDISWASNLEDTAVVDIAEGCSSLTELDLSFCGKISQNSINELSRKCTNLRKLNLRGHKLPFLSRRPMMSTMGN